MSELTLTITTAGRAAQVNAENTGTAPVVIAQIGVTDQAIVPDAAMTTLPGELKRLATFAGAAVAPDTIHVTIRDDSTDVYSLRGFGLYLADGALYGVYGQAGVILEKSSQAMMLLAADVIFADIDTASISFGDTNWINPPATTEVQGVLELATDAEAIAGDDRTRGMTPGAHKAATDARFGVGAPSGFFKPLLALATAAAVRTALELKGAALKDMGAGNGLDADLLDGQHGAYYRDWGNLQNVPAAFPPMAHGHDWSAIASPPVTATRWPSWLEVTGKPVAFTPAAHTHAAAEITSGTLDSDRIPVLAISKISGLASELDNRLTVSTDQTADGQKTFAPGGGGYPSLSTAYHSLIVGDRPNSDGNAGILLNPSNVQGGMGVMFNVSENKLKISDWGSAGAPERMSIHRTTGDVAIDGTLTAKTLTATSSDARLKTEIRDLRDCLDTVLRLRPREYRLRATGEDDFGFVAQEHRAILPQAVHEGDPPAPGQSAMLFVRYGKVEPYLVGAVQELAARLGDLERRLPAQPETVR